MPSAPPGYWNFFGNTNRQGNRFDDPISPSRWYYAFLSKVDLDESTGLYDVLFEVITSEWFVNAISSQRTNAGVMAPTGPAALFHVRGIDSSTLLSRLGLKSADDLAEGSWYVLRLDPTGKDLLGDLYDPDIDLTEAM